MEEDVRMNDFVRQWFEEVWNKGRVTAIDEMLSDSAVVHGLGEEMRGPDAFKPFHAAFRSAFPDITVTVDEVISARDLMAARWTATGTHKGDSLGFPATQKTINITGMTFLRMDADGRLSEGWNSFDRLGMLQQLGVVPATTV